MTLSIDLTASLELLVDLRAGVHPIRVTPGAAAARIASPPRARAEVTTDMAMKDGALLLAGAKIAFDPPLTIKNPVASLDPGQSLRTLKDLLADLEILGVTAADDGRIAINARIKPIWPLARRPFELPAEQAEKLRLPVPLISARKMLTPTEAAVEAFVAPIRALAETARGAAAIAAAAAAGGTPGAATPELARRAAEVAGLVSGVRVTALAATTRPINVAAVPGLVKGFSLGLAELRVPLRLDLGEDGRVSWSIPPGPIAHAECDFARARISSSGSATAGASGWDVEGNLRFAVEMREETIVLSLLEKAQIPLTFDAGGLVLVQSDNVGSKHGPYWLSKAVVDFGDPRKKGSLSARIAQRDRLAIGNIELSFDASRVEISGRADVQLRGGALELDGKLDTTELDDRPLILKLTLDDPYLAGLIPVRVDGGVTASLNVRNLGMSPDGMRVEGFLDLALDVGSKTVEVTRLASKGLYVAFAYRKDGTLTTLPVEGVLASLEPYVDVNGDPTRIAPPVGAAAGRPGSEALQRKIQGDTHGQAKPTSGNRVQLLIDGIASYPRRLEIIDGAKKTLWLQTLIFKDDETGTETAARLIRRARAGVDVRVIIDALGNVESATDLIQERKVYRMLREGGVELVLYNEPSAGLFRDVAKEFLDATGGDVSILKNPVALLRGLTKVLGRVKEGKGGETLREETGARMLELVQQTSAQTRRKVDERLAELAAGQALSTGELLLVLQQVAGLNHRWHEKYLVADGRLAIMGGMNIADEYMYGGTGKTIPRAGNPRTAWRDTDVSIEGPAAAEVHRAFARNWKLATGKELPAPPEVQAAGDVTLQIVQHKPRLQEGGDHYIQNVLIENLKGLHKGERAWFANAYFLPTGGLAPFKLALADAAGRGVDVRVVTNSEATTDLPQINRAAIFAYRDLLEDQCGVRIWERSGDRTMHSKYAVLGSNTVVIGSWNADNRSESLNSEGVVLIYDAVMAAEAEKMFLADCAPDVAKEIKLPAILGQKVDQELESFALAMISELL